MMGTVRYDILSLKPGNQREAEDPKKSDLPDVHFWLIAHHHHHEEDDDDFDWWWWWWCRPAGWSWFKFVMMMTTSRTVMFLLEIRMMIGEWRSKNAKIAWHWILIEPSQSQFSLFQYFFGSNFALHFWIFHCYLFFASCALANQSAKIIVKVVGMIIFIVFNRISLITFIPLLGHIVFQVYQL